jgi:hypothetical protein
MYKVRCLINGDGVQAGNIYTALDIEKGMAIIHDDDGQRHTLSHGLYKRIIELKKIGTYEDYYRTYYKAIDTGLCYCKVDFRGYVNWYTTSCNGGEPDIPVGNFVEMMEVK